MTDSKRDAMLMEMHATLQVVAGSVQRHDKTLYGNGQPGNCKRLDVIQERQDECRRQSGKQLLKVAIWASVVSPLSVVAIQQLLERL